MIQVKKNQSQGKFIHPQDSQEGQIKFKRLLIFHFSLKLNDAKSRKTKIILL